jgi:hypothetical protein
MNLGPNPVNTTFRYLLNQSGTNITLGDNTSVNWNGANVVARTGAQTISGIKTFASNIAAVSFGNEAFNNQFGYNCSSSNIFGSDTPNNNFGDRASENYFGPEASANYFGGDTTNSFGNNADINSFGVAATDNTFGNSALANMFGQSAETNIFGDSATSSNSFGNGSIGTNYFGDGAASNIFGGGIFNSGIKLLLPQFSGASSQAGQFGELRISGSGLYVCTGESGGWRRTFLQSF